MKIEVSHHQATEVDCNTADAQAFTKGDHVRLKFAVFKIFWSLRDQWRSASDRSHGFVHQETYACLVAARS
jgi:hypothetical protein